MSFLTLPVPSYLAPKQVVCLPGALGAISAIQATRVAIIASKRAAKYGAITRILANQKRAEFQIFNPSWADEPTVKSLQQTLLEIEYFQPDYIVAIGGGSVLDGAKLVWAFYEHPHFPSNRLSVSFALPPLRRKAQFCAVPTTAGTGSEASSAAIISDYQTGKKTPIVSHDFLPDLVILDPELLLKLPKEWICLPALDALAHTIEGYTSTQHNALADGLVLQSARDLLSALDTLSRDSKNLAGLEKALRGAYSAGLIQNMMLVGPAHAIAHQLVGTNIPHGLATGTLLPSVILFNANNDALHEKYLHLAKGIGLLDVDALVNKLRDIPLSFGVPTRLSQWPGAKKPSRDIGKMTSSDFLARFFPVPMTPDDANNLFEAVW
jgi:alcohol dehydrogenase